MTTQANIPDPKLTNKILQGVYNPEFLPQDLDLNDFIQEFNVEDDVRRSLESKSVPVSNADPIPTGKAGIPIPLTEAEAVEADKQIQATINRIRTARTAVRQVRDKIDKLVSSNSADGEEYNFTMDISRKRRIRRAIKKLFGFKTDTITYSMYKEMLEAKKLLEEEEASAYVRGGAKKSGRKNKNDKKGKKGRKKNSTDEKKRKKGFLRRSADGEDPDGPEAMEEEQYMRMFPKMGRDFVHRGDFERQVNRIMDLLDPLGRSPVSSDITEARRRAREYKSVLDSGKDGSKIYKDIIKLEDD